ncbi:MAG: hypothetical protein DVB22_002833 [Verrucomicrobia bacterium]|jgi:hypothetical protein|nr:MAG: hypothetical protein DVB22_002833 [Verrucomicrobiota bacterium]
MKLLLPLLSSPFSSPSPSPLFPSAALLPPRCSDELLDAFGDQPVALVTYPDGRQQLLAVLRSPSRNSAPR